MYSQPVEEKGISNCSYNFIHFFKIAPKAEKAEVHFSKAKVHLCNGCLHISKPSLKSEELSVNKSTKEKSIIATTAFITAIPPFISPIESLKKRSIAAAAAYITTIPSFITEDISKNTCSTKKHKTQGATAQFLNALPSKYGIKDNLSILLHANNDIENESERDIRISVPSAHVC